MFELAMVNEADGTDDDLIAEGTMARLGRIAEQFYREREAEGVEEFPVLRIQPAS